MDLPDKPYVLCISHDAKNSGSIALLVRSAKRCFLRIFEVAGGKHKLLQSEELMQATGPGSVEYGIEISGGTVAIGCAAESAGITYIVYRRNGSKFEHHMRYIDKGPEDLEQASFVMAVHGRFLAASSSWGGAVLFWDLGSKALSVLYEPLSTARAGHLLGVDFLPDGSPPTDIMFSADGSKLLLALFGGLTYVWDVAHGHHLRSKADLYQASHDAIAAWNAELASPEQEVIDIRCESDRATDDEDGPVIDHHCYQLMRDAYPEGVPEEGPWDSDSDSEANYGGFFEANYGNVPGWF